MSAQAETREQADAAAWGKSSGFRGTGVISGDFGERFKTNFASEYALWYTKIQ